MLQQPAHKTTVPAVFLLATWLVSSLSYAEVFVYLAPDGSKVVTDHRLKDSGYTLLTEKETIRNVGRILSERKPPCSGSSSCFKGSIATASRRFNVDPALIAAVIDTESSFNPAAMSKKGATGLMQLMDSTADQYRVFDSMDPDQSIHAGVRYLSELMLRFNHQLPLVLAAYNAGAGAVERHGGVPPYPETQRFIQKVMRRYEAARGIQSNQPH